MLSMTDAVSFRFLIYCWSTLWVLESSWRFSLLLTLNVDYWCWFVFQLTSNGLKCFHYNILDFLCTTFRTLRVEEAFYFSCDWQSFAVRVLCVLRFVTKQLSFEPRVKVRLKLCDEINTHFMHLCRHEPSFLPLSLYISFNSHNLPFFVQIWRKCINESSRVLSLSAPKEQYFELHVLSLVVLVGLWGQKLICINPYCHWLFLPKMSRESRAKICFIFH